MQTYDLDITNDVSELKMVSLALNNFVCQGILTQPLSQTVELCLEEVITNVIFYGYPDDVKGTISLHFKIDEKQIKISVKDNGIAFNPLVQAPVPDIDASIEKRNVGGLGIFLVKQFMDEVEYYHDGTCNHLTLTKSLTNN